MSTKSKINILCLDGGGSKGMYTLGVLSELEKQLGSELYSHFDLIYGTSTGSIIAAMLGIGNPVADIKSHYLKLVPQIMGSSGRKNKSKKLHELGSSIFHEKKFETFKTGIGIVAMNYDTQQPLIFKNHVKQAHGTKASFEPGFDVTILDAIEASCAACPVFCKKILQTTNKGKITAIDGGFIANNPTLFALIDATKSLNYQLEDIRLLSVGVGTYVEKPISRSWAFISKLEMAQIASRVLVASSNTTETITKLLFPELNICRINDSFPEPQHGTNMIELKIDKLNRMFQLGQQSYSKHEQAILQLLK